MLALYFLAGIAILIGLLVKYDSITRKRNRYRKIQISLGGIKTYNSLEMKTY